MAFHMELSRFKAQIRPFLYFLLIFSLFFSVRFVFESNSAFKTGSYSDFTSFSLYFSDLVIIALFLLNWRAVFASSRAHHVVWILTTWIALTFALNWGILTSLNYYFLVRFLLLIILYFVVFKDDKLPKRPLIYWFCSLAALQSIIALMQFLEQRSLGLYLLGESHLSPASAGVAKIVSHGTRFIRGYGTFPHSNLLSAFLFTAILFSLYLIFTAETRRQKILASALLVINIFGLTVTFSRAGIAATILILIAYFGWLLITKFNRRKVLWATGVAALSFVVAFAVFHQFLLTRATITDEAVKERAFYNHIGLNIIKSRPWQGIGFGSSVLHMQQFAPTQLEPWEIQPIHNYYLLAAAEVGLIGAGLFIILFLWHLIKLFQRIIKNRRAENNGDYLYQLTLGAILCGFLILMLFDHYFYTINQTQLLLWLVLGLIGREIASSKDYL